VDRGGGQPDFTLSSSQYVSHDTEVTIFHFFRTGNRAEPLRALGSEPSTDPHWHCPQGAPPSATRPPAGADVDPADRADHKAVRSVLVHREQGALAGRGLLEGRGLLAAHSAPCSCSQDEGWHIYAAYRCSSAGGEGLAEPPRSPLAPGCASECAPWREREVRRGLLGGGSCGLLEGRGLGIALTGVSAAVGGTRTGARVRVWKVVRQNVLCADVMTSMSYSVGETSRAHKACINISR